MPVTEDNRLEYLQLFVEQRLVGGIRQQVEAFRNGLSVFFGADVLPHRMCDPYDVQLLLCGTAEIDVERGRLGAERRVRRAHGGLGRSPLLLGRGPVAVG